MTLGEKIYYYRKKCKLSQEELAAQVGVSRQAVSKWELGEATPEVEKLLSLSRTFAVTTDQLLSPDPPEETTAAEDPLRCRVHMEGEERTSAPRRTEQGGVFPEEELRHYGRHLGGLIRRKGYMAGYILSLYGLGPFVIGLIFSIVARQMGRAASSVMGDPFGTIGGWDFSGGTVITTEGAEWVTGTSNGFSAMMSIPQTVGALIMIVGIVMIVAGIVLAQVLKRKMAVWEEEKNENRD